MRDRDKKSQLYSQLRTTTLKDVSQQDAANAATGGTKSRLDIISDPVFVNEAFEDEIERINMIGQASNSQSQSGIIRGSLQRFGVNGINNATAYLQFPEGNWVIQDVIVTYTGGSGTLYFRSYYYDPTEASPVPLQWFYGASSSSTIFNYNDDSNFDEVLAKHWGDTPTGSMEIGFKPSGTFDADSMTFNVIAYRVR